MTQPNPAMDRIEVKAAFTAAEDGTVEGIAWPYGTVDLVGDEIEPKAFEGATAPLGDCEAAIAEHGLTMVSPQGETKRRPETTLLKEYHATLARLAGELGLTPASRAKNKGGAPGAEDDDAFGDL